MSDQESYVKACDHVHAKRVHAIKHHKAAVAKALVAQKKAQAIIAHHVATAKIRKVHIAQAHAAK